MQKSWLNPPLSYVKATGMLDDNSASKSACPKNTIVKKKET